MLHLKGKNKDSGCVIVNKKGDRADMFIKGVLALMFLVGCQANPGHNQAKTGTLAQSQLSADTAANLNKDDSTTQLSKKAPPLWIPSWEKGHPERSTWSSYIDSLIRNDLLKEFDKASDAKTFCSRYDKLSEDQKSAFWTELISAIAFYESGWNSSSRYREPLGLDPVTKQNVYSEGLLQLSYQDRLNHPYCKFEWGRDKDMKPDDPGKSILQPITNLDCGIRILGNQIMKKGRVIISKGAYWAVIKEGGSHQKVKEITEMTGVIPFCRE